jgi:hypothetical protein
MTTTQDERVYDAQRLAFEGTPLGDMFDRRSLIAETREIAEHPWVLPFVGQVYVGEASVRLATQAAYAQYQTIRFAPNIVGRHVAVHELAHIIARRAHVDEREHHGPGYRAIYAELAAVVYGPHYGRLLREAFFEQGLEVGPAKLPLPVSPIIDIDRLAEVGSGVRWL